MHPIKEELDKVSPSFCAAKWLQVTLRLQNGHNHSCHHPKAHKISPQEIALNPSALHNTDFKKQQRKLMLEGSRPPECSYCWKVEDLPGSHSSDRHFKSGDYWAKDKLTEIAQQPWDQNVIPTYLEVSFSNVCNFKCAYCYPDVSSKWMSEIEQYGPYPTSSIFGSLRHIQKEGLMPLPENQNPYLDAFWKWIPEIINHLHVLRVTGGEPLLSKDCIRLMEFVDQNPNPKLNFSLNSNLGVPSVLVQKVVDKMTALIKNQKIRSGQIFTSLDTWGSQAEYIRFGLDLELWKKNLDICLLNSQRLQIVIMITFNALSVFKFKDFLQFILEKRKIHGISPLVDISILHEPPFLNLLVLKPEHKALVQESLMFMKNNSSKKVENGFLDFEISKLERISEYLKTELPPSELTLRRIDFVNYFQEYDRRKKTNFLECFPEMTEVFAEWQKLKSEQKLSEKALYTATRLAHHHLPRLFLKK